MRTLIILLSVCATTLVACTKLQEDAVAKVAAAPLQQTETTQIVVDFTQFPARTIFTARNATTGDSYKFDSDSMKYYTQTISLGEYNTTWRLVNITEDARYKAKMVNHNQGTVTDWKTTILQISGHQLKGSYTFTRVDR